MTTACHQRSEPPSLRGLLSPAKSWNQPAESRSLARMSKLHSTGLFLPCQSLTGKEQNFRSSLPLNLGIGNRRRCQKRNPKQRRKDEGKKKKRAIIGGMNNSILSYDAVAAPTQLKARSSTDHGQPGTLSHPFVISIQHRYPRPSLHFLVQTI